MKDWIAILDDFLRISRKDILTHAGRISAQRYVTNEDLVTVLSKMIK